MPRFWHDVIDAHIPKSIAAARANAAILLMIFIKNVSFQIFQRQSRFFAALSAFLFLGFVLVLDVAAESLAASGANDVVEIHSVIKANLFVASGAFNADDLVAVLVAIAAVAIALVIVAITAVAIAIVVAVNG